MERKMLSKFSSPMNLLMLNWRDLKNPKSGGAEVLTEGILAKLAERNQITLFTAAFPGCHKEETVSLSPHSLVPSPSYRIIRRGSEFTVRFWAFIEWHRRLKYEKFDVVVDQIHGLPFFTPLYSRTEEKGLRTSSRSTQNSERSTNPAVRIAFIHEVAGSIWFKMVPFPFSFLGYYLEKIIFRLFYRNTKFITVSKSTKEDLIKSGVLRQNILIIPEAIDDDFFKPYALLAKESDPTLIFLGRLAKMKRPDHVIKAFEIAKQTIPNLKLWMVGPGERTEVKGLRTAEGNHSVLSPHSSAPDSDITYFGKVTEAKKRELLSKAHILVSCSLKEGFGLVVIEAAAMNTPSIVYNVAGYRDSVKHNETGLLTKEDPNDMAQNIVKLVNDKALYEKLKNNAYQYSQQFNFTTAAKEFEDIIKL